MLLFIFSYWTNVTLFVLLFFGAAIYLYLKNRPPVPEIIHSNWAHFFPEFQFQTLEFYTLVKEKLVLWKVPDTSIDQVIFTERGAFSHDRIYLRVKYGAYSFDICAAPYGTGFFVSWWFGENIGCLLRVLMLVPVLGTFIRKRIYFKTYYILDVQAMFQEAVRLAVNDAMNEITRDKGIRLSELDLQYKSNRIS